jgi:hypothetical protein
MTGATLADIARRVMASEDAVGLLAYGSSAIEEADSASDVDLVCVTKNHGSRHLMMTFGEAVVDIYASTRPLLEQSIRSDKRTNNNFVLNAFTHGRPLLVEDGSVAWLMSLAKAVWEAGPLQPGPPELRSIGSAVQKAALAARKFASRAEESPEWRELAHINMGYLFVQTVYAYCRVHRVWASAIPEMLRWTDPQYRSLIGMCRNYLRAELFEQRAIALNSIADATLSKVRF